MYLRATYTRLSILQCMHRLQQQENKSFSRLFEPDIDVACVRIYDDLHTSFNCAAELAIEHNIARTTTVPVDFACGFHYRKEELMPQVET